MTEAAPGKLTRQELYERIRETSKDEYILSEMKRLGFWPKSNDKPSPAEEAIERQAELEKELRELTRRLQAVEDPEAALKAMRKQRMLESRERQEENRQRRNQERFEKSAAWHERQGREIGYLGAGVSAGLNDVASDSVKLGEQGLPVLSTAADIAEAMGIDVRELRFLSFTRDVSRISHYKQFEISKKTGGTRRISAPMPRLKRAQYWVLDNVFAKLKTHAAAHGFVSGKSIVSNAEPHVGAAIVVNMDLRDFFPTISYRRVKGLVKSFGYSEQVATILALLCTESETDMVDLHGVRYFVARGERRLPQGSPASPAVSNLVCRRLDRRLQGMAAKLGFAYTRYADDMTFSASRSEDAANVNKLLWRARAIIKDEGFAEHTDKTRIMRRGARQEVTGIVVNDKVSLDRVTLRRFRAALHRLEKDGPDAVEWNGSANVMESMAGYANYFAMVDPERGRVLQKRMTKLRKKHRSTSRGAPTPLGNRNLRATAAAGKAAIEGWWEPAAPPEPELEKTQLQLKAEKLEAQRAQRAASRPPPQARPERRRRESVSRDEARRIDPKTGRFKPSIWQTGTTIGLLSLLALIARNPDYILLGLCVGIVNHVAWRFGLIVRIALMFFFFGGLSALIDSYF